MRKLFLIFGLVLYLLPTISWAENNLEKGLALFDDLEYEAAIPFLEKALQDTSLSDENRARAGVYLAIINIAFGDEEKALLRFVKALNIYPDISLPPNASPPMINLFESTRAALSSKVEDKPLEEVPVEKIEDMIDETSPPPEDVLPREPIIDDIHDPEKIHKDKLISHSPPAPGYERARIEIKADPARLSEIEKVVIMHRRSGEQSWFDLTARKDREGFFAEELPAPGIDGKPIEYYIEAFNLEGELIGQLGSPATPLMHSAPVDAVARIAPAKPDKPFYKKWWFFTGTGAMLAAGIGGTLFMILSDPEDPQCGSPSGYGCIRVEFR